MNKQHPHAIATRELTYRVIGESELKPFTIRISAPYLLDPGKIDIPIDEGAAGCTLSFEGLPEREHSVSGVDTFQALELGLMAAEHTLRRLSKKYEFYWEGDPYFDD